MRKLLAIPTRHLKQEKARVKTNIFFGERSENGRSFFAAHFRGA